MKGISIKRRSKDAIQNLIKASAELRYSSLDIGIMDGDRPHLDSDTKLPSGLTIMQIAMINEFGTKKHPKNGNQVPARPFIGPVIAKQSEKYVNMIAKDLPKVLLSGKAKRAMLSRVGHEAKGDIRNFIKDNSGFAPLSAAQIKKKGHAQPLYHTFQMYDAIGFRIKGKGEK